MRLALGFLAIFLTAACGDNTDGNTPPVLQNLEISGTEDMPVTRGLPVTDADGDDLTVTLGAPMHGTITASALDVTYTPEANYHGTDTVEVMVSDGANTVSATISIVVAPVNDAPVTATDTLTGAQDTVLTTPLATLLANDTDVDGDTLTVMSVGSPQGGSVEIVGTDVVFTPTAGVKGAAGFTYTATDGMATALGMVEITLGGSNDAPVAVDDVDTVAEDTALAIPVAELLANDTDPDAGTTLTVTGVGGATNGTVGLAAGVVTFTPAANFNGAASFTYTVSDGALTDVGNVVVTVTPVNDAPIATDDVAATGEDTTVAIPITTLLGNDTDIDGPSLAIASVSNATGGTVSLTPPTVTFVPTANFVGVGGFDYLLTDGTLMDTGHVTINVTVDNDPPVAVDDVASTAEDTAIVITGATLVGNDTDPENDTLMVQAVNSPVNGTVAFAGGNVTFTPAANFTGTASFQYVVTDGALTDTGLVTVTVTPVADAPIALPDARTTAEDTPLAITRAALLLNDSDPDGTTPTFASAANPTNGTLADDGTTITFTPAANYSGPATFEYTITDGALTAMTVVTITVTPENDAPIANDDTRTIAEDVLVTFAAADLTMNDTDLDPGATLTVIAVNNCTSCVVSLVTGTISLRGSANFAGTATFEYTVSDGTATDVGLVTVTITPVDDAPVANPDLVTALEDTPTDYTAAALLANDTDPDDTLALVSVGAATNGTVALNAGIVTFTPAADFFGAATFQYTITGGAMMATGTVSVTVTAVNDAPVAVDDTDAMAQDTTLVVPYAQLLANDTDLDSPPASLTVTMVSGATNGAVVGGATSASFTPAAGFTGVAGFDYVVSDGAGGSDTGRVTITVSAGPVCGDGNVGGSEVCDDGGTANGDGCSMGCLVETGWTCAPPAGPSVCTPICGDAMVVGTEPCDNGGTDLDGCTSLCVSAVVCDAASFPGATGFAVDAVTGTCYAGYAATSETWSAGHARCVGEGGYLATAASAAENTLMHTATGGAIAWIGLTDAIVEGSFGWITAEPVTFTSFGAGQPDDGFGNSDCVAFQGGAVQTWDDTDCNFTGFVTGTVCEFELDPCGDNVLQTVAGEECEDGGRVDGDGCSATCQLEDGCGDGNLDAGEECDDDNLSDADACSSTCLVLDGCGDGNLDAGEQCDDDNVTSGDGCSATCTFERLSIFTFTGALGSEVSLTADAPLSPLLSTQPVISRGTAVTAGPGAGAFAATMWTMASAIDADEYFQVVVTPAAGATINLTRFEVDERRSSTGPRQWVIRSSLDGFVADLATFMVPDNDTTRVDQGLTLPAAFTGLTAPVTFRLYAFQSEGATGSWRVDNVEIFGFGTP